MCLQIEVNETGTSLTYQPGSLLGGRVEHQCSLTRGVGYWLEPILALAPFCKDPLHLSLSGVTNHHLDPSPDMIKQSCLSVMRRFMLDDEGLEVTVKKRGAAPGGGGLVVFKCPVKKSLRPVQVTDQGKIKRIRGVAWAVRVSPSVVNRMVEVTVCMFIIITVFMSMVIIFIIIIYVIVFICMISQCHELLS